MTLIFLVMWSASQLPAMSCRTFSIVACRLKDTSYMERRLVQLAEDARPLRSDHCAGKPNIYDDEQQVISKIYARIQKSGEENSDFSMKYQREIEIAKIPNAASRHDREIAMASPWTGKESTIDLSNRMLQDAYKPLKDSRSRNCSLRKKNSVVSRRQRLSEARENSLDYKLKKDDQTEDQSESLQVSDEDTTFKELCRERLLGPSGSSNLFSTINSIASQRIEDAIARGQFRDLPRGQEIKHHHSPFVDTTEYFLNRIIQRQGAAPPWIEKQGNINFRLDQFRKTIAAQWKNRATHYIVTNFQSLTLEEKVAKANEYALHEENQDCRRLRDRQWEEDQRKYHELSVKEINNDIRGYNLQAPQPARKGYTTVEMELEQCYKSVAPQLAESVRQYSEPLPEMELPEAKDLYKKTNELISHDRPENHYGILQFFRDLIFRRHRSD